MGHLLYDLAVLDHGNLVSILDGGEAGRYHNAGAPSLALSSASWTICAMNKPKCEFKTNTAAVSTCDMHSLPSV